MYDFTEFSLTLNEMNPYVIDPKGLAPTDSRYRPDIRLLEHADLGKRFIFRVLMFICSNILALCIILTLTLVHSS